MKKDSSRNPMRSTNDQDVDTTNEFLRARRLEKKRRVQKIRAGTESGYGNAQDMSEQSDDTQDDLRTQVDSRATSRDEPFTEN